MQVGRGDEKKEKGVLQKGGGGDSGEAEKKGQFVVKKGGKEGHVGHWGGGKKGWEATSVKGKGGDSGRRGLHS